MKQSIQDKLGSEEDLIRIKNTYENDVRDFKAVSELVKKNYSAREINHLTKISRDKIHAWKSKKHYPLIIQYIEESKRRGYFSINKNSVLASDIAYLLGVIFGDGNIARTLNRVWFYGVCSDLQKFNAILKKFNVKGVVYKYKIDNGKMAVHDTIFTHFLVSLGAPIGDKTNQIIRIPNWILKGDVNIKRNFLRGLFDSELSCPALSKDRKIAFQSLKFYTAKEINLVANSIDYLNTIKKILGEFGITSSDVKKDRTYVRSRDNSKMQQLYFVIQSNYINLYDFLSKIGFLMNTKRKLSADKALVLIENLVEREKEKIKIYPSVIKLRKNGLSAYKIAKELNLDVNLVKSWVYVNRKPRLYNSAKFNMT